MPGTTTVCGHGHDTSTPHACERQSHRVQPYFQTVPPLPYENSSPKLETCMNGILSCWTTTSPLPLVSTSRTCLKQIPAEIMRLIVELAGPPLGLPSGLLPGLGCDGDIRGYFGNGEGRGWGESFCKLFFFSSPPHYYCTRLLGMGTSSTGLVLSKIRFCNFHTTIRPMMIMISFLRV